ncbi:mucin-5AC-like [Engraulis encrasicolus]|uniref:mucin-5AC-like n=1 Tax=Engraulis encrasicolus TaxID=184585 RepID=UPI002FD76239
MAASSGTGTGVSSMALPSWVPQLVLTLALLARPSASTTETPAHNGQVCSTWGNYHFKTFDGDFFQLPFTCSYRLLYLCDDVEDLSIQFRRRAGEDGQPAITALTLRLEGLVVQFTNDTVLVDSEEVTLPFYAYGLHIAKTASHLKILSKIDVAITWKSDDSLSVELSTAYKSKTCGLCGNFNGVQDEFIQDGEEVTVDNYGHNQKADGPTESCEEIDVRPKEECPDAHRVCSEWLQSAAFNSCVSLVPVERFVEACAKDMCQCSNSSVEACMCDTVAEFSRQCGHAGGRPEDWRSDDFCSASCPLSMEHRECGNPCTDTCSHQQRSSFCEEHCTDGCFCPAGTVFDDVTKSGCVKQEECPCYVGGQVYQPGESFSHSCRECTCEAGYWSCSKLDCPGTCELTGGSHFNTFDGKTYTFHGECTYMLTKLENVTVEVEVKSCEASPTVSCLKSVILHVPGTKIAVKSTEDVTANGLKTTLPMKNSYVSVFKPSTFYIIAHTYVGLQVEIQLQPIMQVNVIASPDIKAKTSGLCGNFNDVLKDDFRAKSGLIEGSTEAFANSWRTQICTDVKQTIDNPCSMNVDREKYAKEYCSLLTAPKGIFSVCHSEINPETYYQNCMYDTCNCQSSEDCMCAALSSYVHACAARGIHFPDWRKTTCGKYASSCPATMVYSYNVSCGQTCLALSNSEPSCQVKFGPVDGCVCPEGTYLNDKSQCVPAGQCHCIRNGEVMRSTEKFTQKDGTSCTCRYGVLHCSGLSRAESCSGSMIYVNCTNSILPQKGVECQKSCFSGEPDCTTAPCKSGCVCPYDKYSDENGKCLDEEDCPCKHNGALYEPGAVIQQDCNKCTCRNRKWVCSERECHGTCVIYGDGHYITFDEKNFVFDGECNYVLAETTDSTEKDMFRIVTENVKCGTTGTTCSKEVKIFFGGNEIKLSNDAAELVKKSSNPEQHKIHKIGIYLVVITRQFILLWDKKTTVMIKMRPELKVSELDTC